MRRVSKSKLLPNRCVQYSLFKDKCKPADALSSVRVSARVDASSYLDIRLCLPYNSIYGIVRYLKLMQLAIKLNWYQHFHHIIICRWGPQPKLGEHAGPQGPLCYASLITEVCVHNLLNLPDSFRNLANRLNFWTSQLIGTFYTNSHNKN